MWKKIARWVARRLFDAILTEAAERVAERKTAAIAAREEASALLAKAVALQREAATHEEEAAAMERDHPLLRI